MHDSNPIANDMRTLDSLLRESVAPHLKLGNDEDLRILNIACGPIGEGRAVLIRAELGRANPVFRAASAMRRARW